MDKPLRSKTDELRKFDADGARRLRRRVIDTRTSEELDDLAVAPLKVRH